MLSKPFLSLCLMLCLAAPLLAQAPTRAQLETQRDLLQRYSASLMEVNDRYQVVPKILDLASQDQLDAINSLRISPSQAMDLVKLVQENLPAGPLDDEALKSLQKTLQPQMEQLLGSEQFDLILQLFPTPQQKAAAEAILAEAANTPEGQAAYQAAQDLRAALTPDQRSFLQPFLDLAKPPTAGAASTLTASTSRPGPNARNLVMLRRTSAGDFFADVLPEQNYLTHLPRTYRVQGGDPRLMAAMATSSGIPMRLLGRYEGDVLRVATGSLLGSPPMLALGGGGTVWHGKLPGRLVSANPAVVELDAGSGQKITVTLDPASTDSVALQQAGPQFMVEGTCFMGADQNTLYDARFSPWQAPSQNVQAACLLQVSEAFFDHAAETYIAGNPDKLSFGDAGDLLKLRVVDLGMTLQGCQPTQGRVFGMAVLSHSGLDVASVQLELVGQVGVNASQVSLAPVPGGLQLRLNYPLYAEAPASWITNLERIMGPEYAKGFSFAIPADSKQKLVDTGLVTAEQIDGIKLWTLPTEDRRLSLVAMTCPTPSGSSAPALNALDSRIVDPGEVLVSVPEHTINDTIKSQLPGKLPMLIDVPEDLQEQQGGVKLKKIEIAELDTVFQNGAFKINNCVLNVHWRYGIFAGVEPGIKFSGTATLASTGDPAEVVGRLAIDQMDFISPRILAMPAQEQADLKDKLLKEIANYNLKLGDDQKLSLSGLSSQASLVPTSAGGSASPSELWVQGRLSP